VKRLKGICKFGGEAPPHLGSFPANAGL